MIIPDSRIVLFSATRIMAERLNNVIVTSFVVVAIVFVQFVFVVSQTVVHNLQCNVATSFGLFLKPLQAYITLVAVKFVFVFLKIGRPDDGFRNKPKLVTTLYYSLLKIYVVVVVVVVVVGG